MLWLRLTGSLRCSGLWLRSTRSRRAGSVAPAARGVLLEQGLNPCPLRSQVDSQPLDHKQSPLLTCFICRLSGTSRDSTGYPAASGPGETPRCMSCRLREQSLVKELRPRDVLESSSDSDEKAPAAKPSSLPKRKLELEGEAVEKKKKGRPRKDARLLPMSLSMQVRLAVGASGPGPPHPPESSSPQGSCLMPTAPASVARVCPAVLREEKPGLRDASALAVARRPDRREGHCVCVRPSTRAEAANARPPESLHPPGELALGREPAAVTDSGCFHAAPSPSGALWLIRAATQSYGAASLFGDPAPPPWPVLQGLLPPWAPSSLRPTPGVPSPRSLLSLGPGPWAQCLGRQPACGPAHVAAPGTGGREGE